MLYNTSSLLFLSTLSLRRATPRGGFCYLDNIISIHALLAESDLLSCFGKTTSVSFLSTLSLRRATSTGLHRHNKCTTHFYPRSPCGERRTQTGNSEGNSNISIHALLAESDKQQHNGLFGVVLFLSTLSLRRATVLYSVNRWTTRISIHALLAESDFVNHLHLD